MSADARDACAIRGQGKHPASGETPVRGETASTSGQRANLGAEWNRPEFTLEQKQAAIVQSLTAVIIHPAPNPGAKFTPDQITPVWRHDED